MQRKSQAECALFLKWASVTRAVSILTSGSFEFPRAHPRIFDTGRVAHRLISTNVDLTSTGEGLVRGTVWNFLEYFGTSYCQH